MVSKMRLKSANRAFTVMMLVGVGGTLFVSWDSAGRNSFELLSVIHRLNLLPESIPTRPILMWWVLLPVFLGWGVKEISQKFFQTFAKGKGNPHHIWLLPVLISSALIAYAVTLSPTATNAPRWCFWFSLAGIVPLLVDLLPQKRTDSEK
jgi:hypothetical protein